MNGALEFNSADIEQMAGRGNRSQGTSSAHVFLCSSTKGKSIEAILSTNNSKVVTEAATWLKNLFERYKDVAGEREAEDGPGQIPQQGCPSTR